MDDRIRSSVPAPSAPVAPRSRRPDGVNGFAVAALVIGLAGGPVIGVWLAFVAIRQIRETGQPGMWMAVTGLVASVVWTLAIIITIAVSAFV